MNINNFDNMYYENQSTRSPNSQRQLNRQPSRQQFEANAYLPSGLYPEVDQMRSGYGGERYGDVRNATVGGGYGGGYDMGGQSWNAGAFGQNNTMNAFGGGSGGGHSLRKPPSRGRAGLPSVRCSGDDVCGIN